MIPDDQSRAGLDLLLREHPEAEVALVIHQRHQTNIPPYVADGHGPWTCVDLIIERERKQFAIWNYTGDVYRVQGPGGQYPGAVEDDPFLKVLPTPEQIAREEAEKLGSPPPSGEW